MSVWYVETKCTLFSLCQVFEIVPSLIGVWMDYPLEVLLHVVKRKNRKEFEIRWHSVEEMKASSALLEQNTVHRRLLLGFFAISDAGRMPCADFTNLDL